jgi:lipopolysaccharide biosynthesis glycosyltransferase
MPSECLPDLENPQIIHFNLASKPWLNEYVPYEELFWKYAALSGFEADIRARREQFLRDTQAVRRYKEAIRKLIAMAARLTGSEQSFRSLIDTRVELRLCS